MADSTLNVALHFDPLVTLQLFATYRHEIKGGCCNVSKFSTNASAKVKCLRESSSSGCSWISLPLPCPAPPPVFALPITAQPPFLVLLFCLISRSLSSRAPACPRDSEPLNIHPLSSIAPLVLLEGKKKKKYDIELFRAQSGLFLATAST